MKDTKIIVKDNCYRWVPGKLTDWEGCCDGSKSHQNLWEVKKKKR